MGSIGGEAETDPGGDGLGGGGLRFLLGGDVVAEEKILVGVNGLEVVGH